MNKRQVSVSTSPKEAGAPRHSWIDDAIGLFTGVVLVALGVHILVHLGLIVGQTAGLALVISYATGIEFGLVFFIVNLPFYGLAIASMGWVFTLRTLGCVATLSALTSIAPVLFPLGEVDRLSGALVAGVAIGFGILALFRHRASLGGIGILAFYLQEKSGFRAGWTQLAADTVIFAAAFAVIPAELILYSLAGAVFLNVLIGLNHRRDRYVATS